jgi:hypothetical protein
MHLPHSTPTFSVNVPANRVVCFFIQDILSNTEGVKTEPGPTYVRSTGPWEACNVCHACIERTNPRWTQGEAA